MYVTNPGESELIAFFGDNKIHNSEISDDNTQAILFEFQFSTALTLRRLSARTHSHTGASISLFALKPVCIVFCEFISCGHVASTSFLLAAHSAGGYLDGIADFRSISESITEVCKVYVCVCNHHNLVAFS